MIQNICNQCHHPYGVNEAAGFTHFQCPHCGATNPLTAGRPVASRTPNPYAPVVSSEPRAATSFSSPAPGANKTESGGSSTALFWIGGLVFCLMLLIAIGVGIWSWRAFSAQPNADAVAVAPRQRAPDVPARVVPPDLPQRPVRPQFETPDELAEMHQRVLEEVNRLPEDPFFGGEDSIEKSRQPRPQRGNPFEESLMPRPRGSDSGSRGGVLQRRRAAANREPDVTRANNDKVPKESAADAINAMYLWAEFPDMGWGLTSLAFSPSGNLLFAGHRDEKISVYDLEKKTQIQIIEKLASLGSISEIAASPDGKFVLAGGYTGRIEVWRVDANGKLKNVGRFVGHTSEIKSIAVDPDSKFVLSGDTAKSARLWNLETQREHLTSRDFKYHVVGTGFMDGGKTAVACCRENIVYMDVAAGKVDRQRTKYRRGTAYDIAFSPDGREFTVTDGSSMKVYETETATEKSELKGRGIHWKLEYAPDGQHLVAGEKTVAIWNMESASKVFEFNVGKFVNVQAVAVSPDGRFVTGISSNAGSTLTVFKNPLGDLVSDLE